MPDATTPPWSDTLIVADLPATGGAEFSLNPDTSLRGQIAAELGILTLRKIRFAGALTPIGKSDWQLRARLGATVVQNCVVTLVPVTTRIDEQTERSFVSSTAQYEADSELEVPEDETAEPISASIDVGQVMVEALALALPQFPRALGAELAQSHFTEPGKVPMSDADARPFAGLKSLRGGSKNHTD